MFSKFGDTLTIPDPELTASESDPIVLSSDNVKIKWNKATSIPMKFYNSGSQGLFIPTIECMIESNSTGANVQTFINLTGADQTVSQGDQKLFRMLIPAETINTSQAVCVLAIGNEAKQIAFEIDGFQG